MPYHGSKNGTMNASYYETILQFQLTVPRRHLLSLIDPQQPKNAITAIIAPTAMMMMDPVTYFTEESAT